MFRKVKNKIRRKRQKYVWNNILEMRPETEP